jgi:hypothetical protein
MFFVMLQLDFCDVAAMFFLKLIEVLQTLFCHVEVMVSRCCSHVFYFELILLGMLQHDWELLQCRLHFPAVGDPRWSWRSAAGHD